MTYDIYRLAYVKGIIGKDGATVHRHKVCVCVTAPTRNDNKIQHFTSLVGFLSVSHNFFSY